MTVKLLRGDCRALLRDLADNSIHACITSPPYWGLRKYLPAGHQEEHLEIGSEPTLGEWVRTMVEVFEEVRRVLRPDGLLFLNLGDAYAGSRCGGESGASTLRNPGQKIDQSATAKVAQRMHRSNIKRMSRSNGGGPQNTNLTVPRSDVAVPGLKPKDLMGQPWRVAFALQDAGWWLRQELIWRKKNPMPESVTDRWTKAHEHVFMLAKSERYWFDLKAIKQPVSPGTHPRRASNGVGFGHGFDGDEFRGRKTWKTPDGWDTRTGAGGHGSFHTEGREKGKVLVAPEGVGRRQGPPANPAERKLAEAGSGTKNNDSFDEAMAVMPETRNPRDVLEASEDEFLQFLDWKAEQAIAPSVLSLASEPFRGAHYATFPTALIEPLVKAGCPPGGVVLDPFGGSGTTGEVCERLGRDSILIDLDERNVPMAHGRITAGAPLLAQVEVAA